MKKLNEKEYKKLIDDIATIKSVLAKSRSTMRFVFLPVHFWFMSLLAGISVVVMSGFYYLLVNQYTEFSLVPELYRNIFYIALGINLLILSFIKLFFWNKSVSSMNPDYTFKKAILEFITFKTIHTYIVFAVTTIFFIVYWIVQGNYYLIIPTLSISMGLIINMIGNITELVEYIVYGSWMLVTGLIIFAVGTIPGPLAIIISFGIGCLIFAVHSLLNKKNEVGDNAA